MTRYEKMSLGSLLMLSMGYAGFLMLVLRVGLARLTPGEVLWALGAVFVVLAIGHAALWIALWSRQGPRGDAKPDEREERIELLADRFGYVASEIGIGLLFAATLAEGAGWHPLPFPILTFPGLVVVLVTASFLVASLRLIVAVLLSRRAGG